MTAEQKDARSAASNALFLRVAIRSAAAAVLIYLIYVVVSPFISILVWTAVLTVTFYPIFEWLAAPLGGRRRLAAVALTFLCLLIVVGPISRLAIDLIEVSTAFVERIDAGGPLLPSLPETLRQRLGLGAKLFEMSSALSTKLHSAFAPLLPDVQPLAGRLLAMSGSAGAAVVNFLTAVVAMGFFFLAGPAFVTAGKKLARKVDATHGAGLMELAGKTIHAISSSVIGTSLLEAVIGGVGMSFAGLPGASLLTLAILAFGIVQIGPMIVVIPVMVWAWISLPILPALGLSCCMAAVAFIDVVLKPYFLSRGVATPAILSMIGVFGGVIAYGVTGLFIGPIVLAVGWRLSHALLEDARDIEAGR